MVTSLDGNVQAPETIASTPTSSSLSDGQRGHTDGQTTDFTSTASGTSAATTPQNGLRAWGRSMVDNLLIDPHDDSIGNDTQAHHSSQPGSQPFSTSDGTAPRAGVNYLAQTQANDAGTVHARSLENSSRSTQQVFADGPIAQVSRDHMPDCYTAILTRTTKLEQALVTAPRAPPIDLVLEAERDLQVLKQRLFSCIGHGHNGRDCLASDRPVLLSLSLLAERVVTMLEETFRFAAATATATSGAMQDPSGNPLPATMVRRLERSFRGLLDQPCVFPIPAGNLDIRVGNYVVDGPVKARAVKGILQLRIRKMLGMLEGMKRAPKRNDRRDSLGGPLDWGGSTAVLEDSAGLLVQDLIRRMEALQGGMALMG